MSKPMIKLFSPQTVVKALSYWPPYFFSGVSVKSINPEFTRIEVCLKQRFWNTNYVGTHFGGTLYSMCDPFYMFILLDKLKKDHIIWDKAAEIEFVRPGKGTVTAIFEISEETIKRIEEESLQQFKSNYLFKTLIMDSKGQVVAKVQKVIYVRRKDAKTRFK